MSTTNFLRRAGVLKQAQQLVLVLAFASSAAALADEVFSRSGLDPSQQSKVTGVLARERIQRTSNQDVQAGGAPSQAAPGAKKECRTDIGNVNTAGQRPGQQAPTQNIVVIKAPVVNTCR